MARKGDKQIGRTSPTGLLDLELPLTELKDGLNALQAMNPHIAIGDAGVLWVASKLQDSCDNLKAQWLMLLDAKRGARSGKQARR